MRNHTTNSTPPARHAMCAVVAVPGMAAVGAMVAVVVAGMSEALGIQGWARFSKAGTTNPEVGR